MGKHDLLQGQFCCIKIRGIQHCTHEALAKKQDEILSAKQAAGHDQLLFLLASDGKYYFGGGKVCHRYLITVLRSSNRLQNTALRLNAKVIAFGAHERGHGLVSTVNTDKTVSSQAKIAVMTLSGEKPIFAVFVCLIAQSIICHTFGECMCTNHFVKSLSSIRFKSSRLVILSASVENHFSSIKIENKSILKMPAM